MSKPRTLPTLTHQAQHLLSTGLLEHQKGLTAGEFLTQVTRLEENAPEGSLLAFSQYLLPASVLAPFLQSSDGQKKGFVVEDMTDIDLFGPSVDSTALTTSVYAVTDPQRGDEMRNWSPKEASDELNSRGRVPLTLTEALYWTIQDPSILGRGACFMAIGSRLQKPNGPYDSRTPALWISNGTGRDGKDNKDAPKIGWCWWNNRHTWLGFASGASRVI